MPWYLIIVQSDKLLHSTGTLMSALPKRFLPGLALVTSTFKATLTGVHSTAIGLVGVACMILWESVVENAANADMVFVAP